MKFASGISDAATPKAAFEEVISQTLAQLAGEPCDVAFVFVSAVYQAEWDRLLAQLHARLHPSAIIGCSGGGIIGTDRELEWVPAVSILAARMPGVHLSPFTFTREELALAEPGGFWIDKVGASPQASPVFVMLADPFTCDPVSILGQLNQTYRARPVVGGLVSGGHAPGDHVLFCQDQVLREGAVGLAMTGNITMDTIVSQGCRPIGRPYVVTEAEENLMIRLAGKQAITVLHDVLSSLSSEDRDLAQQGSIFGGVVINEMRPAFSSGDFLIRNIVGIDPSSGAVAISDGIQVGQTFQFHLRDANTSREELKKLLHQHNEASAEMLPSGGLVFSCLGRGKSLYGVANHDVKVIRTMRGKFPMGGFFCNGEIGPVGVRNFVHGYTASLGLFRPLGAAVHPAPQGTSSSLSPS